MLGSMLEDVERTSKITTTLSLALAILKMEMGALKLEVGSFRVGGKTGIRGRANGSSNLDSATTWGTNAASSST